MTDGSISDTEARIDDALMIMAKLFDFYTPDEALLFMRSPQPQLNGETAISAIGRGRHADVREIIERMDSGVYL